MEALWRCMRHSIVVYIHIRSWTASVVLASWYWLVEEGVDGMTEVPLMSGWCTTAFEDAREKTNVARQKILAGIAQEKHARSFNCMIGVYAQLLIAGYCPGIITT